MHNTIVSRVSLQCCRVCSRAGYMWQVVCKSLVGSRVEGENTIV